MMPTLVAHWAKQAICMPEPPFGQPPSQSAAGECIDMEGGPPVAFTMAPMSAPCSAMLNTNSITVASAISRAYGRIDMA